MYMRADPCAIIILNGNLEHLEIRPALIEELLEGIAIPSASSAQAKFIPSRLD